MIFDECLDIDTCVMLFGSYGENLQCPTGYIGTGTCASGKGTDCGTHTCNRLKCCKIRVESEQTSCQEKSTGSYGEEMTCNEVDGRITLLTEYCGSGAGKDCPSKIFILSIRYPWILYKLWLGLAKDIHNL